MLKRLHRQRAFTLSELLIVVAVLGVLLALAGPPIRELILMQRLRSVNSQLVTDLQYARAEAAARGALLRVSFRSNAELTCYTLYTSVSSATRCDCQLGPGAACASPMVEVRTVQVPRSLGVKVEIPHAEQPRAMAFDPTSGGLYRIPTDDFPGPMDNFVVESSIDNARRLHTVLNRAGRPAVCSPAGSKMSEAACPS